MLLLTALLLSSVGTCTNADKVRNIIIIAVVVINIIVGAFLRCCLGASFLPMLEKETH